MKQKHIGTVAVLTCALILGGCAAQGISGSTSSSVVSSESSTDTSGNNAIPESSADSSESNNESSIENSSENSIESSVSASLSSTSSTASSLAGETQIDLSKGSAEITKSGTYRLTGTLSDGELTVNVDKATDEGDINLIFDGASINSKGGTPLTIQGKNAFIILEEGTENTVTQGAVSTADTEFPNGAIYSQCDLVIEGSGTLNVTTEYNDGISGRDDLTINGGSLNVTAAGDGIVGKDSLTVTDGTLNVQAGKDGLRSTNETDSGKGVLTVSGGTLEINAQSEGLEGIDVNVSGGSINITSGDDGINVKLSTGTLTVSGGDIYLKSGGDGLDSNGNINQTGGNIVIDTAAIGPSDTPVDYDGSYSKSGGTLTDQNGGEVDTSNQMGGGRGGMGGFRGQEKNDNMTPPGDIQATI